MIFTWNPAQDDRDDSPPELLVAFDRGRRARVLVLPAWFDEANKLRRLTLGVMRNLDAAGIDSLLPDLPGCNESLVPLESQTLESWRAAAQAAAGSLRATHVLAIRAGALIAPSALPGFHYAPQTGPKLLRGMLRGAAIAAREAGKVDTAQSLLDHGRTAGLTLGGWMLGGEMIRALETAEPAPAPGQSAIPQSAIGGAGLWLRAEPDDDPDQAERLSALIAANIGDPRA